MPRATLSGIGLHSGVACTVELYLSARPACLVQRGVRCSLDELLVLRTDFGVTVGDPQGRLQIDLVEHLFAALAVLNATTSIEIEVDGPELPLLDGGCGEWLRALERLGVRPRRPSHYITRTAHYDFGATQYRLFPSQEVSVEVQVDFSQRGLGLQRASFDGSLSQFREQIASARTFGFLEQASELQGAGRARGVDPKSVLVFDAAGICALPAQRMRPNELAAHKLLDLLGDSLLYGALPLGKLHAFRPGHTTNHAMLRRARAEGVIQRRADTG